MWTPIHVVIALTRSRIQTLRDEPEAGYATETVVITALLVALALAALAILTAKVVGKVSGIEL